ncbi:MAG: 4Fe-4S binding protein [Clostridia bacterium]|jgi:flavodoxin/ferredoxin|nr:4Fe-4S binding protein [Clostridia bacterium]MBT7123258.1 4Fe-4S binding protein [Clostridia bacterium]
MYKAIIFYFSGTGNTWWVAGKINIMLDARSVNAESISIETLIDDDIVNVKKADWLIKASDLVFFGWPMYGSDLPHTMKLFIDSLAPLQKQKHVHTFCTQMMFSGDGAWVYHKHFAAKGLIIDSCAHFNMPTNMSVLHGPLSPPKTDKKAQMIMNRCELRIETYINDLLTGKARRKGKFSYPLGILQRAPHRLVWNKLQNLVGVNKELCTKCGLCADICPTSNIVMRDYPNFSGKCALCFRCYSYCPAVAITACGRAHNTKQHGLPYRLRDKRFSPFLLKPKKK